MFSLALERIGCSTEDSVASAEELLKKFDAGHFDLLVICRALKDETGKVIFGIDDVGSLVLEIKKISSGTEILLIAGEHDEEGKAILNAAEQAGVEDVLVTEPGCPISAEMVENVFSEIKKKWEKPLGKLISITGTRTGVGKTTIAAALATMLHDSGVKTSVLGTPGIKMHLQNIDLPVEAIKPNTTLENMIQSQLRKYDVVISEYPCKNHDLSILVVDQTPESIDYLKQLKEKTNVAYAVINAYNEEGVPVEVISELLKGVELIVLADNRGIALKAAAIGRPDEGPAWVEDIEKVIRKVN